MDCFDVGNKEHAYDYYWKERPEASRNCSRLLLFQDCLVSIWCSDVLLSDKLAILSRLG